MTIGRTASHRPPTQSSPPPEPLDSALVSKANKRERQRQNRELAKVERDGVRYSLTTPEIQKLRAAGVSETVIEAMLRSGRTPAPVGPTPVLTPR